MTCFRLYLHGCSLFRRNQYEIATDLFCSAWRSATEWRHHLALTLLTSETRKLIHLNPASERRFAAECVSLSPAPGESTPDVERAHWLCFCSALFRRDLVENWFDNDFEDQFMDKQSLVYLNTMGFKVILPDGLANQPPWHPDKIKKNEMGTVEPIKWSENLEYLARVENTEFADMVAELALWEGDFDGICGYVQDQLNRSRCESFFLEWVHGSTERERSLRRAIRTRLAL